jgi:uncharacterized membrane protein YdjX (TVP38/TMEM64 family)
MRVERLHRDLLIIAAGVAFSIWLSQSGLLADGLSHAGERAALASLVAGAFFTSVFTIAPATAVLAALAGTFPPLTIAFWGALGAMFADALLFLFVRDVFADDLREFLRRHHVRLTPLPHFGFLRWLYPLLGALIIASPLPDELGLALLGLTKTKLAVLLPLAFAMNFLGILALGALAASI